MRFCLPRMGEEVEAIGGRYVFTQERSLDYGSEAILYLVGCGVYDRSCCGYGGCSFVLVVGSKDPSEEGDQGGGRVVSVRPVREELHEEIARLIRRAEPVSQVIFVLEQGGTRVVF